jgi:hypothetical protein
MNLPTGAKLALMEGHFLNHDVSFTPPALHIPLSRYLGTRPVLTCGNRSVYHLKKHT